MEKFDEREKSAEKKFAMDKKRLSKLMPVETNFLVNGHPKS